MRPTGIPFVVIVLLGAASAAAQDQPASNLEPNRTTEIRALFQKGLTHYNLHEYPQAIEAFKEGYRLSQAPGFLFNIAQAYRMKGECSEALRFYEDDVRLEPNAGYRNEAETHIEEMRACVAKAQATAPPAAAAPTEAAAPQNVVVVPREETPGRTKRVIGLVTGGVGVALVGVGVYFSVQALQKSDQCTRTNLCLASSLPALDSDGQSADRMAKIFYAVGGALVLGGGILYYLGWRDSRAQPSSISFVPTTKGFSAAWRYAF